MNKKTFYFFITIISIISTLKILFDNKIISKDIILSNLISETINAKSTIANEITESLYRPTEIIYSSLNKIVPKDNLSIFSNVEDEYNFENDNTNYVEDPNPKKIDEPLVYIYNTHQLEEYEKGNTDEYTIKPNVMIASYIIRESLNNLGINSIVETGNIKEYLNNHSLNYSKSYEASRYYMLNAIEQYPSLKYFVDIHRDSSTIDKTLYNKDGKEYARILFIIGLDHDNYKPNLDMTLRLNELIEADYEGISRGIYKKSGQNVNGIYNQDINDTTILIEVGGVDNTLEQVNNTCELIAIYLKKYIEENNGEKKEK